MIEPLDGKHTETLARIDSETIRVITNASFNNSLQWNGEPVKYVFLYVSSHLTRQSSFCLIAFNII